MEYIYIRKAPLEKKQQKKGDPFLAQIYQVPKTLGNRLCTLEILMSDHQLSYLFAYFQRKFSLYGSFWGGFPIFSLW